MNPTHLPLDWTFLNILAEEDPQFAQELLKIYCEDGQVCMQRLIQAIETENYDLLYSMAHYLTGASSNVGAIHIVTYARKLEELAHQKEIGNAMDLVKLIQSDFQKIQELLIPGF